MYLKFRFAKEFGFTPTHVDEMYVDEVRFFMLMLSEIDEVKRERELELESKSRSMGRR